MTPRVLRITSRIGKKSIYVGLISFFVLFAILPTASMIEAPLYGQQTEPFTPWSFDASTMVSGFQPKARLSKGKFLVASRQLKDPNFSETVVLLIEYDRSGAMGLVVNRPTEIKLASVLPDMEGVKGLPDTLYVGGPVAKNHMVLLIRADSKPDDSSRVFDDVYVSSSRALLQRVVDDRDPDKKFRLYAGYAGWSPGQLDRELARGGWHVLQADVATVFDKAPSEIWPELIDRSSGLWVQIAPFTS